MPRFAIRTQSAARQAGLGPIVDLCVDGRLDVESLITHRITLGEINEGFDRMAAGEGLRSVVVFES